MRKRERKMYFIDGREELCAHTLSRDGGGSGEDDGGSHSQKLESLRSSSTPFSTLESYK